MLEQKRKAMKPQGGEKPKDWNTLYDCQLAGKELQAMQFLAHWAATLEPLPIEVMTAADCVWLAAERARNPQDMPAPVQPAQEVRLEASA